MPTQIPTTRFGRVAIEPTDVLYFPAGILGLVDSWHWVLLADSHNETLGWLQSTSAADVALAVVSPRRFVSDYQVRVTRADLAPLALAQLGDAQVLVVVSRNDHAITLNLKAPILINLHKRLGVQVVNNLDLPLQYELACDQPPLKKSA